MADACGVCCMLALHFNSVELSKMMKDSVRFRIISGISRHDILLVITEKFQIPLDGNTSLLSAIMDNI